jgi:CD36 family
MSSCHPPLSLSVLLSCHILSCLSQTTYFVRSCYALMFKCQIKNQTVDAFELTDPSSDVFKSWASNKNDPLTIKAYMYNITNPDEVLLGARAKVKEVSNCTMLLLSISIFPFC